MYDGIMQSEPFSAGAIVLSSLMPIIIGVVLASAPPIRSAWNARRARTRLAELEVCIERERFAAQQAEDQAFAEATEQSLPLSSIPVHVARASGKLKRGLTKGALQVDSAVGQLYSTCTDSAFAVAAVVQAPLDQLHAACSGSASDGAANSTQLVPAGVAPSPSELRTSSPEQRAEATALGRAFLTPGHVSSSRLPLASAWNDV